MMMMTTTTTTRTSLSSSSCSSPQQCSNTSTSNHRGFLSLLLSTSFPVLLLTLSLFSFTIVLLYSCNSSSSPSSSSTTSMKTISTTTTTTTLSYFSDAKEEVLEQEKDQESKNNGNSSSNNRNSKIVADENNELNITETMPNNKSIPVFETDKERKFYVKNMYPSWWVKRAKLGSCPHTLLQTQHVDPANVHVYIPTYWDRSGAVIYRMIAAYAYAVKHGYTFGGGIPRTQDPEWTRKRLVHERLINAIGLSDVLRFVLPMKNDTNAYNIDFQVCIKRSKDEYIDIDFLKLLRSKQNLTRSTGLMMDHDMTRTRATAKTNDSNNDNDNDNDIGCTDRRRKRNVAVHVRRGDAHPCTKDALLLERYRPNALYTNILQKYVLKKKETKEEGKITKKTRQQGESPKEEQEDDDAACDQAVDVVIYSEVDSFETWDEFRELGYRLDLGGPIEDAWIGMMTADQLVMSAGSYFSMVPALLNPNHNDVYTTNKRYSILYNWTLVDGRTQRSSKKMLRKLIDERCDTWINEHPEHNVHSTPW